MSVFLKSVSVLGANISLGPLLQSEEITGTPQDMALIKTFPKPSQSEGKIKSLVSNHQNSFPTSFRKFPIRNNDSKLFGFI